MLNVFKMTDDEIVKRARKNQRKFKCMVSRFYMGTRVKRGRIAPIANRACGLGMVMLGEATQRDDGNLPTAAVINEAGNENTQTRNWLRQLTWGFDSGAVSPDPNPHLSRRRAYKLGRRLWKELKSYKPRVSQSSEIRV